MSNRIYGQTFVVYPDSFDMNAFKALDSQRVPYAYALHDKDVDENGVLKKPHIHVYVQGKLNSKQKEFLVSKGAPNYFEDVRSDSGMWAYLTHENSSGKFHYERDIIMKSSSFCVELIGDEPSYDNLRVQIIGLINHYDITEYRDIVDLCISQYPQFLKYVMGSGRAAINDYIASMRYSARDARRSDYLKRNSIRGVIEDNARREDEKNLSRLQGDVENGDVDISSIVFNEEEDKDE